MRLLLYSDVHWSETSSIIKGRGEKYSIRLENLINSVNWAESIAEKSGCDAVICLGDFFDKPNLTAEEITSLKELRWADLPHYFIVGNHDSNIGDLSFASTFVFKKNNFEVVHRHSLLANYDINNETDVIMLPYITEDNRELISDYISSLTKTPMSKKIILSHNDIAGINYGKVVSQVGFKIDDILKNCDLFINGHLHNSGFVDDGEKILNIGNLSGQNFSENAFDHKHYCAVLDTDNLMLTFYQNPYAFNFYKIIIDITTDISKLNLGPNAIVSAQCVSTRVPEVRNWFDNNADIVASRLQSIINRQSETVDISSLADSDYLQQFSDYILAHLDNTDILNEELSFILR